MDLGGGGGSEDCRQALPTHLPQLNLLNPLSWAKGIVFRLFGSRSPPEYLSDILPLAAFYSDNEARSAFVVTFAALVLCLLVVFVSDIKSRRGVVSASDLVPWKTVSLCKVTPSDVGGGGLNELIEDAFSPARLAAVCFVFDLVHEITPMEALVLVSLIKERASKRGGVPLYSFVENHAFSVGYLLALVGQEIYATEVSLVGNLQFAESSRSLSLSSKDADYFHDIDLSEGRMRQVAGSVYRDRVSESRGEGAAGQVGRSGAAWIGQEAVGAGLVDGVKNFYEFIEEKFPHAYVYKAKKRSSASSPLSGGQRGAIGSDGIRGLIDC